MAANATATLHRLRRDVAAIEANHVCPLGGGAKPLILSCHGIDAVLDGGLNAGALHEIAPAAPLHVGAAAGFVLALAAKMNANKRTLWIGSGYVDGEAGGLYGHGLTAFGLPLDRVLMLRVAQARDAFWAMEEALRCPALGCVIAELPNDGPAADLTATRRLMLAAREGGGFGFLLRYRASALTSAAETRWEVAGAASRPDRFGGLGQSAFSLSLTKNRRGPLGRWIVAWNHHDRSFSALSGALAAPAADRPARAPLARAG
ncbi:ImuA family protein [Pseudolabrys sp.]|uniref:ImuA family protein n=1 Tax=Pseudolabrys sp. TaxID=1960880 RepID=UPI003D120F29